ncbi:MULTISPECIES: LppP/LprE family lipoprotein [unclassified Nocardia]|uniref:LppP/LprE family lipoprotein n=1 Tax=unclassified Nocardia TaxID=2637762 RepID=UPI001CE49BFB|nr:MULTISPECIES: LppP/LprE family lipoprotein [unclassified Nocardia]
MLRCTVIVAAILLGAGQLAGCGSAGAPAKPVKSSRPAPVAAPPGSTAAASQSGQPGQPCGVNLGSPIVRSAVSRLPAEPVTGARWSTESRTYTGDFDTCATLSVAIVPIEKATGSSPEHALLFHKGEYIGTATPKAYGFTAFDPEHTTDETVGLTYKTPGSCDACPDGTYTHVQFRWDGTHVQMIGAPPS